MNRLNPIRLCIDKNNKSELTFDVRANIRRGGSQICRLIWGAREGSGNVDQSCCVIERARDRDCIPWTIVHAKGGGSVISKRMAQGAKQRNSLCRPT